MPLAVITGGTRGIGRAIVDVFSEKGFDIVTCSRDALALSQLKGEVESKYKTQLVHQAVDIGDASTCQSFVEYIKTLNEPVDLLVNNAGIFLQDRFCDTEGDHLEFLLQANLMSAYRITRGLLSGMIERKKGHIFNIGSVASLAAYENSASYTVSKHALLGFSRVLRAELQAHQVRVTSVLPGATYTSSWEGIDLPKSRFVKDTDIAELVRSIFSLSEYANVEDVTIRPTAGDI